MPPKNLTSFILGFIIFILFLTLTILESTNLFLGIDPLITRSLQSTIPRTFDIPLSFFSLLGSPEMTSVALLLIFYYLFRKEKVLLYSLGLFGVILILEVVSKLFIYHPGPPKYFFRYALPFSTPEYLSNSYSFPSGHVSRTFFLAIISWFLIRKNIKNKNLRLCLLGLIFVICFLMAISRVYLGEHWSSDVVGGVLLGSAMGFLAMVYY